MSPLGVGRDLGGEGLAASIEDGPDEVEAGEDHEQDKDQGDGLWDLAADKKIEDGRDGEGKQKGQAERDEDGFGQLQEDPQQEKDHDPDAELDEPVLVHSASSRPHHS
jgi:hypothetical protein